MIKLRSSRLLQCGGIERQLAQSACGVAAKTTLTTAAWPTFRLRPFRPAARSSGRCGPRWRAPRRCAAHLVGIEVGLLDTTVFQRDLAVERRCDAEDDLALGVGPQQDSLRAEITAAESVWPCKITVARTPHGSEFFCQDCKWRGLCLATAFVPSHGLPC